MAEMTVNGTANDFAIKFLSELFSLVGELDDFSGTDEGEIEGVEKEHGVLVLKIVKGKSLKSVLVIGFAFEVGG
jgi:hypothetical protein